MLSRTPPCPILTRFVLVLHASVNVACCGNVSCMILYVPGLLPLRAWGVVLLRALYWLRLLVWPVARTWLLASAPAVSLTSAVETPPTLPAAYAPVIRHTHTHKRTELGSRPNSIAYRSLQSHVCASVPLCTCVMAKHEVHLRARARTLAPLYPCMCVCASAETARTSFCVAALLRSCCCSLYVNSASWALSCAMSLLTSVALSRA